jgi:hypothetical protein
MYQLRRIWTPVLSMCKNVSGCGNASVTARRTRCGAAAQVA